MQTPGQTPPGINERWLLLTIASIQFTCIVDFLIIMPLGPDFMTVFHINPGQFGIIVSAYAIAAGISGIVGAFVLDRFDRKTALLTLYAGFTVGTLFCGLAPTYPLLVAARFVAGAFGGVVGALILAIVGDVVPEPRRGAAMGLVMSAFSVASICGVPMGLYLASLQNWHLPFFALAGLSVAIWLVAARVLPSLRIHMAHAREEHPVRRMIAVLSEHNHQMAFVFMVVLTFTGFCIFPYIATFMVKNAGLAEKQLPLIYFAGGMCTLVSMNWIGRWADRVGKRRVFTIVSLAATVPIVWLTNLKPVPLATALAVSTLFMVCMSGRSVPAMAMMTAAVETRYRGGFMSVNTSLQQFACGLAAYGSGFIMGEGPGGRITHFPIIGGISVVCALSCAYLAGYLKPAATSNPMNAAVVAEPL